MLIIDGASYAVEVEDISRTADFLDKYAERTESGDYTFTAYFSGVADRLLLQRGPKNYWTDLTVKFTAKSPARR